MTENSNNDILLKAEKSIKKGKITTTPKLIVLMGLPGSGKSYVSSYLNEKHGYTVLSGENITCAIFGTEKCSGSEYALAYKTLRELAIKLLKQGYSVVIDGTNLKHVFRKQIYDEIAYSPTILLYLKTDDKTALERISNRGVDYENKKDIKSSISLDTFNSFKSQLEEPLPDEKAQIITSDENVFTNIDLFLNTQ